jgi:hypothetical protein
VAAVLASLIEPEQQAALERDGFVVLDPVPSLVLLRARFAQVARRYTRGFASTFQSRAPEHRAQVHAALVPSLAPWWSARLRGYRALACGFACKAPGGGALGWHQDIRVTPPGARPQLSLWIPLVDCGPENGGLAVVPGSHVHDGLRPVGGALEVRWQALGLAERPLRLGAGLPVLLHGALVHGSPANHSRRLRPAVTALLAPQEAPAELWLGLGEDARPLRVPDSFFLSDELPELVGRSYLPPPLQESPCPRS